VLLQDLTPPLRTGECVAARPDPTAAHQYGVLDWTRVHAFAATCLSDLLAFCDALARAADASRPPVSE
jgi:hypothetical protein